MNLSPFLFLIGFTNGINSHNGITCMMKKRLVRSNQKVIAGVCGGIAEYFNWDVVWVRVLFVILSVATAILTGVLLYLILWVVMPEQEYRV
jgi:phage shock protein PspC (stress-responsive transcriptional regulator)